MPPEEPSVPAGPVAARSAAGEGLTEVEKCLEEGTRDRFGLAAPAVPCAVEGVVFEAADWLFARKREVVWLELK